MSFLYKRSNIKLNLNKVLLLIAALTSFAFLTMVEFFNGLALDDIGFALKLKDNNIWHFILNMYFTWQGRFMSFLITGLQIKSYFIFDSMLPSSTFIYFVNILLITTSLNNFFKLKPTDSFLFAVIFFQLYIYSMFDISSYFWLCTKPYSLFITLALFVFSELICSKKETFLNYLFLFISSAFLGCSYEIFAPILLLVIGLILMFRLKKYNFNFRKLIQNNHKFIFVSIIIMIFFIFMIIAPGNWVRLKLHSKFARISSLGILYVSLKNFLLFGKLILLKIHYFILLGIILSSIIYKQKRNDISITFMKDYTNKRFIFILLILISLAYLSIFLNTIVVGKWIAFRAFNHINLFVFICVGLMLLNISRQISFRKLNFYIVPIAYLMIISFNIYNIFKNHAELTNYVDSEELRFEKLNILKAEKNIKKVKLEDLNVANYYSIDDLWQIVNPKITKPILLIPNEISYDINNYYNITYKHYYNLNFDIYTDLNYDL